MRDTTIAAVVGATLLLAGGQRAAAAPADGDMVFRQRCQACHVIAAGKPPMVGPNLYGVVNRKAASTAFPRYSEALKTSGLTWTRANLDRYLTAPAKMVPGTKMAVALPDPAQRTAVIDYLARAK